MQNNRIKALQRFALAISVLNIAGFTFLGFEQSYAHPILSLATAYFLEILFEIIEAKNQGRDFKFAGGAKKFINFLLPAHITALAVAMLLYTNQQFEVQIFATAFAILTKYLFRVRINNRHRHFLNPSNAGIAITLILFPWVGISPPYMFTENFHGLADWIFPGVLSILGFLLNYKFTKKTPLILAWLIGFVLQAWFRSILFDTHFVSGLLPMTGLAFLLFTFYMISDPGTTPSSKKGQILFGASVALAYGVLMALHIVFGLFFALLAVCLIRGCWIVISNLFEEKTEQKNSEIEIFKPQEVR
ncbi:hypothetical protein [Flagellimonas sp.]|uniref:hypothetical protein n=1 Tax=Flagellimonas sp. TaxID=2058762 RepID=UPI003F4A6A17